MKQASRLLAGLMLGATTAGFVQFSFAQTPAPDKLVDALEGIGFDDGCRFRGQRACFLAIECAPAPLRVAIVTEPGLRRARQKVEPVPQRR